MAGKIKKILDEIVSKRAGSNPVLVSTTKTKIQLKGINIDPNNLLSHDDEIVLEKLLKIALEWKISIKV